MPIARFGSNAVRCFRPGDAGSRCGTQRRVCSSAVRQAADRAREFPYTSRAAALETGSVPAGSIRKPSFPFSCISGQEALKLALLLNVVDPKIGGVLIMGDRGTGKSVSVRALAELLPDITVVTNDPFNSDPHDTNLMGPEALERRRAGEALEAENIRTPLIELPLGATEDRICGTIDIERALSDGVRSFEPGLLAKANRGILYVDEVNLLEDAIVDVILDASASGMNTVEREGVSIIHPSRFIMIGSGNPQEGELRPQLIDRFGLSVQIETVMDRDIRKRIVLDRMSYEEDPDDFVMRHEQRQAEIRQQISKAKECLASVTISEDLELKISQICSRLKVEGLRGDIVTSRAAKAAVALDGRSEVAVDDIERVIGLCLNHRMRKDPLDPIDTGSKVKVVFKKMTDPKFKEPDEKTSVAKEESTETKPGAWKGLNWAHPLRRRSERFLNGGLKNRSRLNRCGVVALSAGYDALDIVVPVVRSVSTALYSLTFLLGVAFIGKQLLATEHDRFEGRERCPRCKGTGVEPCICTRWSDDDIGCNSCHHTGYTKCSACGGGGKAVPLPLYIRKEAPPSSRRF